MNSTHGVCPEDYAFGPIAQCRGLDVTLVFEESILSLLPASLMIIASFARFLALRNSRVVVAPKSFYSTKSLQLAVLVILRFVLLLLWSIRPPVRTKTSIAAAAVFLVESFAFVLLTKYEHVRSLRPSSLLSLYYFFSLGLDFIRMRTFAEIHFDSVIIALAAADMAIKASLLFSEEQNKRAYFSELDAERPTQEVSGIFSRSVFWWLKTLFLRGYRGIISLHDLSQLDEELSSEDMFSRFEAKWSEMPDVSSYRLAKTIAICLRSLFLAPVIPNIIVMALTFAQPYLVTALLNYIALSDSSAELGYLIIAGYAAVYLGLAVVTAYYTHMLDRFMTMVRGCLVHIIYNQTLRLDMKEAARGDSLTLMSGDVERITQGLGYIHEASSNLCMGLVALGLLYTELGFSFIATLVFSAALSYLSGLGSAPYIERQKLWLEATEVRVTFTASVISSMKGVKILGLADRVRTKLRALRNAEVERAKRVRVFMAIFTLLQTLSLSGTRWITYTAFGIATLIKSSSSGLDITVLFTSLAILQIFMTRLETFLRYMPRIASAFGCLRRIEIFLLLETKRDNRLVSDAASTKLDGSESHKLHQIESKDTVISIHDLSVGWTAETAIVQGVNLDIPGGSMTMIVGPVGSGKSTLIQALLGETVTQKGQLSVTSTDSIAFCAQTPWLINRSIQQNILGTSIFDGPWYLEVLRACALLEDLKLYPAGDRTLIGSKGMTLSGGQKQRIALARAVYSKKPIILLDDVFSGLDPVTEELIFRSLLGSNGILRNSSQTVVLATHAVHLLPSADMVILLGETQDFVYQGPRSSLPADLITMRDTSAASDEPDLTTKVLVAEHVTMVDSEDFVPTLEPLEANLDTTTPDATRQTGDSKIYLYYAKTLGWKHAILAVILGALCMGFTPAQSLWLNAWANDPDSGGRIPYYLGIYSIFFVGEIALTTLWIWHFLIYPLSASSIRLHDIQLDAMISATMAFFSNTDTGVTTNRFSQDFMYIDSELPLALLDFIEYVFNNLYKMLLIAISSAYMLPSFPPIIAAFYFTQRFYLRTSRQIRFIDLETKAPLYTHFLESLSGLSTIRGFGWEAEFERQNRALLKASQRPFFMLATIQRWLTLMLSFIVSVLAIVLALVAVELRNSINPGLLGLALVNVMALGQSLQALVMFWTLMETSVGAVSRIKKFSEDTPSEDPDSLARAHDAWLHSGQVEIKNITARHGPESDPVLRDISLSIAPGQHTGICGRSGSGKSSLLAVLVRLMDITSGTVLIDNTDITSIAINQVRASLNTLSQESFFIHGTIRDNLVTGSSIEETDERLQAVLARVGLLTKVLALGGLDTPLDAEEAFSHGERQLFCLARAMLSTSKVLLLDEFTSNVDLDTDRLMQKIIREDFGDRTIIAVAHRLETILDFDRIVVLDKGRLVEDGSPAELMGRGSAFKVLYDAYRNERGPESHGVKTE